MSAVILVSLCSQKLLGSGVLTGQHRSKLLHPVSITDGIVQLRSHQPIRMHSSRQEGPLTTIGAAGRYC